MEIRNDIEKEELIKDSQACKNVKRYYEQEIDKDFNKVLIKEFTNMFEEFKNDDELEGARKLLNELLAKDHKGNIIE